MIIRVPMDERQKEELVRICGKGVRFDSPMKEYTTFRVGGNVDALCFLQRKKDLRELLSFLHREELPSLVVGRGSNLLVKDGGIPGVAMILQGEMGTVNCDEADKTLVLSGGGLTVVDLLKFCKKSGLGGLEFLAGIPGTVGGAVAMNAGAWGKEVGMHVKGLQTANSLGEFSWADRSDLRFSYRNLPIPAGSIVLKVVFGLTPDEPGRVAAGLSGYLRQRRERQPLDFPSAGSVFKNPPDDFAGRLIERAGLKGKRVGGAMISQDHANFIVNVGQAKAKDVLTLMDMARRSVRKTAGVELETEIKIVGREDR